MRELALNFVDVYDVRWACLIRLLVLNGHLFDWCVVSCESKTNHENIVLLGIGLCILGLSAFSTQKSMYHIDLYDMYWKK